MKGDFSKWALNTLDNVTGVLHQQGRALADTDWNAADVIARHLRQLQGRDAFGPHVVAVPQELKDSFKVMKATANAAGVQLELHPGRVWVDGLVLQKAGTATVTRDADYLGPPIQAPAANVSSIAAGVRDAVILELWEDTYNAFQNPKVLIEPALGGVDTTERVKVYHRLRLLRLAPGDDCGNLAEKLADDFSAKGKLTVSAESVTITGDCPVEAGGGYTGFEHYLFRIEIADASTSGQARFKWSRFNGGLVGRGVKSVTEDKVMITANDQMINHCGLNSFYLEALQENTSTGRWSVTLSANASLSADGELSLSNINGTWPGGAGNEAFFRLWDDIELIADYPVGANPVELALGMRLQFETALAGNSNYTPGDFWTFPVRAAGAVGFNTDVWPSNAPPEGLYCHRAPLAILHWDSVIPVSITAPGAIHDCRRVFRPLTRLDNCCSYTVGDGLHSHGDFDSIQIAINHLPATGGRICVLPGEYRENILISKNNIEIHGCGVRAHLMADTDAPAIRILDASNITIQGLQITAHEDGIGVLVEREEIEPQFIALETLILNAAKRSAIEIDSGRFINISDNRAFMQDTASDWHAVFVTADDVLIEHNEITVLPSKIPNALAAAALDSGLFASKGRGGLHLGGTSERVRVIDNLILGGIGNGITLGTVEVIDPARDNPVGVIGWITGKGDLCDPCAPGTIYIPPGGGNNGEPIYRPTGPLYDIRIERNRILDMGLNGIGVLAFFNLTEEDEFISVVGLDILGNTIKGCLRRSLAEIPDDMINSMGYGGISLADIEHLSVHDNVIEDNGLNHLEPVCGIFVLHGEGVDLSRNRIKNNGSKTGESANGAKQGPRGGIYIIYATAPKIPVQIHKQIYPRQDGEPALKVHDNIVAHPLGRALSATVLGPVSVLANQLTTQGMVYRTGSPSVFASTVYLFNLGVSNEFYLQQLFFSGKNVNDLKAAPAASFDQDNITVSRQGLDDQRMFAYLGNGNVLFNDNQVMLDLIDTTGFNLSVASIVIASLDDISFSDNQCDASFDFVFDDFVLTQAFIFGVTTRVCSNRFKESLVGAFFSALTYSFFANTTMLNQATHCIKAFNLLGAGNLHKQPNTILFDIFKFCNEDNQLVGAQQATLSQANKQPQNVLRLLN